MATYYINADTGNDTTGDGSQGNPWETFNHAYSQVLDGDTIIFQDSISRYFIQKTNINKQLTLTGESVGGAVIYNDIGVSGYLIRTDKLVTFEKLDFTDIQITATYTYFISNNASGVVIKFTNCRFYNLSPASNGSIFSYTNGSTYFIELNSCSFYDINWRIFGMAQVQESTSSNTLTMNNCVLYLKSNTGNELNRFIGAHNGTTAGINVYLKNNIFYSSQATTVVCTNVFGSNNCFYSDSSGTYGSQFLNLPNKVDTNPLFIDLDTRDFQLSPSSPCIDAGTLV